MGKQKDREQKETETEVKLEEDNTNGTNEAPPPKKQKHKKNKELLKEETQSTESNSINSGAVAAKKSKKSKKKENHENDADLKTKEDAEPEKDTVNHEGVESDNESGGEDEEINFAVKDLPTLINRIEALIPANDMLGFRARAKKLDWNVIAFDEYSASKCQEMWNHLMKQQRQHRLLIEIVQEAKEWVNHPWQDNYKGCNAKSHPDFPKEPLSAFNEYFNERKDVLLSENPSLKMRELSKQIENEYKELPEQVKSKYFKLEIKNKSQYEQELLLFFNNHPELAKGTDKSKLELGNLKGARKPHTPFALFFEEQLKQEKDVADKSAFKETCKEKWKNLPEKKKVIWIEWALELEEKYQQQIRHYQRENPNFTAPPTLKQVLTKEEKQLKERMDGKPEKPPNSAYSLFSRLLLKGDELKDVVTQERMKIIAIKWKELPQEEKDSYQQRAMQLCEQYKIDYANYLDSLPEEKREEELRKSNPKKRGPKGAEETAISISKKVKKEEPVEIKKEGIDLVETATPKTWLDMSEGERSMYLKYIQKIKDYFDTQHQTTSENKDDSTDSSDSESDSDSSSK